MWSSTLLALTLAGSAYSMQATGPRTYRLRDIGEIELGYGSECSISINANGEVAAALDDGQAFIWRDGHIELLPELSAFSQNSIVCDINSLGQVAGFSVEPGGQDRAVLWSEGVVIDLGDFDGLESQAFGLNDLGQVVGSFDVNDGGSTNHGFVWQAGSYVDIGTLGGTDSRAKAINVNGLVTGAADNPSEDSHAFLWDGSSLEDLGTLFFNASVGAAINAKGQVVGISTPEFGNGFLGFFHDGTQMFELPTLTGFDQLTSPAALNGAGIIVGRSASASGDEHAFVIDDMGIHDLNDLVVGASDWLLIAATGLNDSGQIVGYGMQDGNYRGFLLDPLPGTRVFGCNVNPAGSMAVLDGSPTIGDTIQLGIDDPTGSSSIGSLPLLLCSSAPDAAFPCGSLIPGFGAGSTGELLVNISPAALIPPILIADAWQGPGVPATFPITLPADISLVGFLLYSQGALFDGTAAAGTRVLLTDAVELAIGP